MRFISTRDDNRSASLSEAITAGIAPDGGLYLPDRFPRFEPSDFEDFEDFEGGEGGEGREGREGQARLAAVAERLLRPFFDDDPLAPDLAAICREALDFAIPLRPLRDRTAVLELFHGPTAAFKDVGARFLARCLARIPTGAGLPRTVLVATSGDTGGAVAAAFHGEPGTEVVVLFPEGRISARQEKQLTCWGGNVRALAVLGDFDDCQRLAKAAFADPVLRAARDMTSANSINLGRLLPQMTYYADAALRYGREAGVAPGFIIPTGNVGNAVACLWARESGLPIGDVVLATNANDIIPAYLETGEWRPRPTTATLANAMDVGDPSNMERLFALWPDLAAARRSVRALAVDDDAIRDRIRRGPAEWGETWDPHTAAAVDVRERIGGEDWILIATAHPAKFESVVEPLVGRRIPVPPALAALLERPSRATEIEPTMAALRAALDA